MSHYHCSESSHPMVKIATVFGAGYVPFMGGTLGALLGVGVYWFLKSNQYLPYFILTMIIIACISSEVAERVLKRKDPKEVIIDDLAGMLVTFLFVVPHPAVVLIGFILFRMFDIVKVFPINKVEKLPGFWGVVGDDILAGIFANLSLQLIIRWVPIAS